VIFLAYAWHISDDLTGETEARIKMEHRIEAHNRLRQTGFTEREIDQLERLRQWYATNIDGLDDLATYRGLQFVRWLVTTGRLTEQRAEDEVDRKW
jgi:hypothetical protein